MTRPTTAGAWPLRVGVDMRCLVDPEPRGLARYTSELVRALTRRPGLEVIGLTDAPLALPLDVEVVMLTGAREVVREQVRLPREAMRRGLQVLFAPANRGLPLIAGRPTVLTVHDVVDWDPALAAHGRGRSRARFAYASIFSLAAATRIITVSRSSARAIAQRLRIDPKRLRVVHEAAGERFFAMPGEDAVSALRARYGINPRAVLYLGGYDAKKDVATAVRAFARQPEELAPQLVLAGSLRHDAQNIGELVRGKGLDKRVVFPGYVSEDELPALYRAVACFLFPATSEGFGLPVLEAMAAELPVVAADAGSLPEVVGRAGLRFPPGDDAVAAALIHRLLSSDDERSRWSSAARQRAEAFSWERAARETEVVLREALAVARWRRRVSLFASLRHAPRWATTRCP
jgi:glycosyltransferase involved in cell wall biosynthesis